MINVLITGINSYIGNSFYEYCNNNYSNVFNIKRISLRNIDMSNFDLKDVDVVLHVSGIAHSDYGKISKEKSKLYYNINTDLTYEFAKKSKLDKVRQFIFISSIIVYGEISSIGVNKVITNNTIPNPINAYGDSKLKAEEKIKMLNSDEFIVSIIRCPVIYGKNSKGNFATLNKIANKVLFFPYINNNRSALHIDSLCEYLINIINDKKSGIYFPQDKEYMNTSLMVQKLAKENNKKIYLIKGFDVFFKVLGKFIPLINKAFGNLVYDKNLKYLEFRKDDH